MIRACRRVWQGYQYDTLKTAYTGKNNVDDEQTFVGWRTPVYCELWLRETL